MFATVIDCRYTCNRVHAERIFYCHGDRLYKLVAAHRARLRKSAGRCDRALSWAQRRESVFSDGRRSTRPKGAAIGGEGRRSSRRIWQSTHPKICRSLEKARREI